MTAGFSVEEVERAHLLRYHPHGGVEYCLAFIVEPASDGTAVLKGGNGEIPGGGMDMIRELRRTLAQLGYRRAQWVRTDGRRRCMVIEGRE